MGVRRLVFTDGWNSFWHVAFGAAAVRFWILVPAFVVYQFAQQGPNLWVDIGEFSLGYAVAFIAAREVRAQENEMPSLEK